ncbi:MAG: hypothetical protein ABFR95_04215 [Actinomycetota bacterium]
MSEHRDPFDILRNAARTHGSAIDESDTTAARILSAATQESKRPPFLAQRRRTILVVVAFAALLLVAAAWLAATRSPSNLSVTCYSETRLDSDRHGTVASGQPDASGCAQFWENGTLTSPLISEGEVPPLVACVPPSGGLAVFPTSDPEICQDLGLAEPLEPEVPLDAVASATEEVTDYIQESDCQPLDEAETEIRRILDQNGLDDWEITRGPDHPDRPCASVAYDIEGETIRLVPIYPRP